MPNTVRTGRHWLNLDFYVEAEEFGPTPFATPGPGWIRIKMLSGNYHDIPAGESDELRRRLDALAGIAPSLAPEPGPAEELAVVVKSAPVPPLGPAVEDPTPSHPQNSHSG